MVHALGMSDQAAELRALAAEIAGHLASGIDVRAVCLLGSVARGDADEASDLDLLVLTGAPRTASHLLDRLPDPLRDPRLALIPREAGWWKIKAAAGDLFAAHVALEGQPLFDPDGVLAAAAKTIRAGNLDTREDVRRQMHRLRLYRDVGRWNGNHLFALARLYAIGKTIAIARCAESGEPLFVKDAALHEIGQRRPQLADAVETVRALRPFYDLVEERAPQPLPYDYHHAESKVLAAVAAIEHLAYG